jgi:hypothetical protein
MTGPQPLTCPRCGAEAHSGLPLCNGCGALLAVPLAAALRPQGFGHQDAGAAEPVAVTFAPAALSPAAFGTRAAPEPRPFLAPAEMPAAYDAGVLAPAPVEPAPVAPPVVSLSVAAPAPPPPPAPHAGKKRHHKQQPRSAPEEMFAQYGLSAPPPAAPAPVAPYPPAADVAAPPPPGLVAGETPAPGLPWGYPQQPAPAPPQRHVPPGYVTLPLAVPRGGSAAKDLEESKPKISALAAIGFILALACGPLGLVLSLIAFARIKASKGRLTGEWMAVLGVIAGVVFLLLWSIGKQKSKPSQPKRAAVTLTLPAA